MYSNMYATTVPEHIGRVWRRIQISHSRGARKTRINKCKLFVSTYHCAYEYKIIICKTCKPNRRPTLKEPRVSCDYLYR